VLERGGIKNLHVRKLGSPDFTMLPGTEGAATPFFSPDGKWIGFFASDALKKIPVDGGNPMTLCEADGSNRGASWGTDDQIVFTPHYTQPLSRVSSGGGEPQPLTTIDTGSGERTHRWPHAVPDEDVILFTVGTMNSPESYDQSHIDAIRPSSGERKTVLEGASIARYVPTGHLIFGREGFLFAVPFDIKRLETTGSPVPVVENVMGMRSSGVVYFGFSNNGLLTYVAGAPRSRESRLVWRYRDGTTEPLAAPVQGYANPRLSPDHKQIALGIEGDTTFDIWTFDIERETLTRLTFEGDNTVPVWSPDGRQIAFASVRGDSLMSVYVKAADGSGAAEMPFSPKGRENWGQAVPTSWSPDGRQLLIEFTNENASNVLTLSLQDSEEAILLESPAAESRPTVSPDGRWMAYASDESGRFEVYVRPLPGPGGKWQISTDGGVHPRWAPDGNELFYRWQDKFFGAQVDGSAGSFQTSRPQLLFEGIATVTSETNFDVFDSDRFLFVEPSHNGAEAGGVTVVVNWLDDLRRRASR
jgi:serine/threonine-protein kinase